ncbi:MAG: NTP transferase domain-containing protein [Candidatus Omnitrophica bacterium]|nr:NTP transferase domain-containing protein [Candidatus Omnitrophota bacterium]
MKRPFVTVILAGGMGSRMGSSDKHKVCFEILGVPVILRALETYNLCGSALNVVVVGMMAEKIMALVNHRFPGTAYAFQENQLGTGDAAKKGVAIPERIRFDGDILVVAGDKVIEPRVIRRLVVHHNRAGADVTILTTKRPPGSSGGIILKSTRGNITGILEAAELDRLLLLSDLNDRFEKAATISYAQIRELASKRMPDKTATAFMDQFGPPPPNPRLRLTRAEFLSRFPPEQRQGLVRVGHQILHASRVLECCDQGNLSVYLFRAPVLYDALHRLHPGRQGQEEYLTDVFSILANQAKPARISGCEISDPHDVMAFNNPEELLAIETVYRQKEQRTVVELPSNPACSLATVPVWDNMFRQPSPRACRQFKQWYGEDIPWPQFKHILQAFADRYGTKPQIAIVRSPGRINLLGRHIDHQGGKVNVMAINREIVMAAAPRKDDWVRLANTDSASFAEHDFRISDVVANLDWDDWQRAVDGPRLRRILEEARGDWANYIKAALLRLQERFRDQRLCGMDLMVLGDIPMGAGLSSSSALVVAAAEAVASFNRLPVSARRLVSLCGEGEWFVGTRGGAADHAAIKLSRRGYVTRVGFFPFQIEGTAPFFGDHNLVVCNSNIYAGKSSKARHAFNERVAAYHIGRVYFKRIRPDLAPKINHLRDISCSHLEIPWSDLSRSLAQLPARISRAEVQVLLKQLADPDRLALERLFSTHDSPPAGYAVRDVVLFGLGEMARAEKCLNLLRSNNAAELGRLMLISHNGDRVSQNSGRGKWKRRAPSPDAFISRAGADPSLDTGDISSIPGAYGCSLPELDRMVDLAGRLPGVKGAQMAGAGLGGCVMVLVEKPHTKTTIKTLSNWGINAEVFRPIAGAGSVSLV